MLTDRRAIRQHCKHRGVRDIRVKSGGGYGPARGQSMNSRRCNLRTVGSNTQSTPTGLTVGRRGDSGPLQGRQGFLASASVGCTYGYSRCPASRDCHRQWTWRTSFARTGAGNQAKSPNPTFVSRTCWTPPSCGPTRTHNALQRLTAILAPSARWPSANTSNSMPHRRMGHPNQSGGCDFLVDSQQEGS